MTHATRFLLALSFAAFASPAAAHPFHGAGTGFAAGIAHPFLGLDHLLAMMAVGVWAAQIGGRALWVVPLSFVGTMLAGGVLGLAGLTLPYVEPMVAASVLALGLLVSSGWKTGAAPGALLVAFFAVFHGLAHAAELPLEASAVTYALGFALATAALHAAGIGAGAGLRKWSRIAGAPIALIGCWMLANALA